MAIIQALCDSFRQEILEGVHNLNSDTIKMALYSPSAGLSNLTTSYTPTGEIVSTGYTAGGQTLVPLNGTAVYGQVGLAYVQFQNPSWTLTTPGAGARGARRSGARPRARPCRRLRCRSSGRCRV